jgi:hypothetical protein
MVRHPVRAARGHFTKVGSDRQHCPTMAAKPLKKKIFLPLVCE